jgi:hypothetical protein
LQRGSGTDRPNPAPHASGAFVGILTALIGKALAWCWLI